MLMPITAGERGFTLVELLVASFISMMVLGGAVMLTSQVQSSYRLQMEDSAAEQEGRYALEWISRVIRAAGNNPYKRGTPTSVPSTLPCPAAGTPFAGITYVPTAPSTLRVMTDSNPTDGVIGGVATGSCTQANEDVTISFDATTNSVTFLDNNLGGTATIRTDAVIDNLRFVFRNSSHAPITDFSDPVNAAAAAYYVETQLTVRTRTINAQTGLPATRTLTQEVRIRGRNF